MDQRCQMIIEQVTSKTGSLAIGEPHELCHVVGPAGLNAGSERRFPHPAERLAKNDGTGGSPIDVQIARSDRIEPDRLFAIIQALESLRESIAGLVD